MSRKSNNALRFIRCGFRIFEIVRTKKSMGKMDFTWCMRNCGAKDRWPMKIQRLGVCDMCRTLDTLESDDYHYFIEIYSTDSKIIKEAMMSTEKLKIAAKLMEI